MRLPESAGALVILGLVAGVLGGLFGIGGGLIIVPVLVLLMGLDQKTATGTSLFALVWPVGLLGVGEYAGRGQVRWDIGGLIALGLLGGVLLGAKLTAPLSPATMKRMYGAFLLIVGTYFLALKPSPEALVPGSMAVDPGPAWPWAAVLVGLVAGVLGGLFGVGGGLIIVPALSLLAGLDPKTAVGTSLFAQVWPVGILGVREYLRRGEARWGFGALIALGLLVGNLLGAWLTRPMEVATMETLYGAFLVAVGIYYQLSIKPRRRAPAP